jgi:hypothetical protein
MATNSNQTNRGSLAAAGEHIKCFFPVTPHARRLGLGIKVVVVCVVDGLPCAGRQRVHPRLLEQWHPKQKCKIRLRILLYTQWELNHINLNKKHLT